MNQYDRKRSEYIYLMEYIVYTILNSKQ